MGKINFANWNADILRPAPFEPGTWDYASGALPILEKHLQKLSRPVILDLNAAHPDTFSYFQRFHSKVYVEDLYQSFRAAKKEKAPRPIASFLQAYPETEIFDVIFCWDVLNYFSREEIAELFSVILPHCGPNTYLFIITSSLALIPDEPMTFRIFADARISFQISGTAGRPGVFSTPADLLRVLKGWEDCRSLHLRNSLQEHLLQYTKP